MLKLPKWPQHVSLKAIKTSSHVSLHQAGAYTNELMELAECNTCVFRIDKGVNVLSLLSLEMSFFNSCNFTRKVKGVLVDGMLG